MSDDVTHTNCPGCGCPDQRVGLHCGFCNAHIPVSIEALKPDGTARVEEVLGFRGWRVEFDLGPHRPRLVSPTIRQTDRSPYIWEPGQWMIAECAGHHGYLPVDDAEYHGPQHANPDNWSPVKECGGAGHGCGFYAARDRAHLVRALNIYTQYSPENPNVIGQVQMSGKIIFATNGFRAQRVRPRTIFVPHEAWELGRDLKAEYGPYGVNIEMSTTSIMPSKGAGAVLWCAKCKAKMPLRSLTCDFCGHIH